MKKSVLKNFAIFIGKVLACNFIEKETPTQVFFCEYYEALKSTYFEAHLLTAGSEFLK